MAKKIFLVCLVSLSILILTILTACSSAPEAPRYKIVASLTAQELISQILENPNRYKEGDVLEVSGIMSRHPNYPYFFLGPKIAPREIYGEMYGEFKPVDIEIVASASADEWQDLIKLRPGNWLTVKGRYGGISPKHKYAAEKVIVLNGAQLKGGSDYGGY